MGIGREVSVVVLQDDQVAVAAQARPHVHHAAVRSRKHRVPGRAPDIQPLVLYLIKSRQHDAIRRPHPVDIIFRRWGSGRWRRCWRGSRHRSACGRRRRGQRPVNIADHHGRARNRSGTGRGDRFGDYPAGRTGRHWRDDTQDLTHFNAVGVVDVAPARNFLGTLAVIQRNPKQRVTRPDCVIAGLASVFIAGELYHGWQCGVQGLTSRGPAFAHPAIFNGCAIGHPGAAPTEQHAHQH